MQNFFQSGLNSVLLLKRQVIKGGAQKNWRFFFKSQRISDNGMFAMFGVQGWRSMDFSQKYNSQEQRIKEVKHGKIKKIPHMSISNYDRWHLHL